MVANITCARPRRVGEAQQIAALLSRSVQSSVMDDAGDFPILGVSSQDQFAASSV